jgi:hypothetical protein
MRTVSLSLVVIFIASSCGGGGGTAAIEKDDSAALLPDSVLIKKTDSRINPYAQVDVSPMDMAYFPADYPKLKMAHETKQPPLARVIYSRPHLQGRHIFKEVLKHNEPWRLGANEATELELFQSATIEGKKIKAGRYILYCIPHTDKWTVVLNSNIYSWGLEPDAADDVARFDVAVTKTNNSLEFYTMLFEKTGSGANLLMAWDDAEVRLPIQF